MLVTKLIKDQMIAQRLHDTHAHLCQIRRQWYEQAKYDTGMWYADAKMLLLICGRTRGCALAPRSCWTFTYDRHSTCGASRNTWQT